MYSKTTCFPLCTNLGVRNVTSDAKMSVGIPSSHKDAVIDVNATLLLIHRDAHRASSTEFRAGKMVLPISSANAFGTKGARNFSQASMNEMAQTNPSQSVDKMMVVAV
mmetsp:Transcript_3417/g.5946  ORF Transcript_3417/g.5946 Transcript_3417/m.5946 type:complete len:108 (+) Transcript_3417:1816-2139(+)